MLFLHSTKHCHLQSSLRIRRNQGFDTARQLNSLCSTSLSKTLWKGLYLRHTRKALIKAMSISMSISLSISVKFLFELHRRTHVSAWCLSRILGSSSIGTRTSCANSESYGMWHLYMIVYVHVHVYCVYIYTKFVLCSSYVHWLCRSETPSASSICGVCPAALGRCRWAYPKKSKLFCKVVGVAWFYIQIFVRCQPEHKIARIESEAQKAVELIWFFNVVLGVQ